MAIKDFIHDARTAMAALSAGSDGAAGNVAEGLARWTASRELWLTPSVLRGFDPNDFVFLSADQRRDLAARAEQFRGTAAELAGREPSPEEVFRAAQQLLELYKPLTEYFAKPEGQAVLKALWAEPVPDFVLALDYTLGTDSTGDPAIWVWVVVRDNADPETDVFQEFAERFRDRAWKALRAVGSDRIPYVRFRLASEVTGATAEGVR